MNGDNRSFPVVFTRGAGIWYWLSATLQRQPLYGDGEIEFRAEEIIVRGLQRSWLAIPHDGEISLDPSSIRGGWLNLQQVEFESKTGWRFSSRFSLRARSTEDARKIFDRLGERQTNKSRFADSSRFYSRLRAAKRKAWVTPALVFLNLCVYVALVIRTGVLGGFDIPTLLVWGANYGSLALNGQWWRLVAYTFLHGSLLHIALNLWVLWSVGRLTERLYGNAAYFFLYLTAGVCGAIASIAWDPARVTVGASGAIFGLLGGLLAYLLREKSAVPPSVFRAYWLPTALFAIFNIVSGAFQPQIDNVVHIGGFVAGALLGWVLARPLDSQSERPVLSTSGAVASLLLAALLSGLLFFAFADTRLMPTQQFLAANQWYNEGEVANLRLWQQLATQAQSGVLSGSNLSDQFEKSVLPFWIKADGRIAAEMPRLPIEQRHFAATFLKYIRQRTLAARGIIQMGRSFNPDQSKLVPIISQLEALQADIERQETESTLMQRTGALSQAASFLWLENVVWLTRRTCTEYPPAWETPVAKTDSPTDGPVQAHALGCLAQKLFLARDYKALDDLLNRSVRNLGDLPDGSSSYEAMTGGLSNLFVFGGMDVKALWGRIVAWRLEIPGSSQPGLAESELLMDWGYQARGGGTVDTISGNAMQAFLYRTKMAASLLPGIQPRSPWWFELSIEANLYLSADRKEMRAIFDRGHAMFSADLTLDRAMLRPLMPRWGGSYEEVLKFVNEQARLEPDANRASQRAARLMWQYSSLEDDQVDIFKSMGVKWEGMAYGLAGLTAQFPRSDYIRNGLAKMACIAGDKVEYSLFASRLPKGLSASAWSQKVSVPACNRKFGIKAAV